MLTNEQIKEIWYSSGDAKDEPEPLTVLSAFNRMSSRCPHKQLTDCSEPSIDFSSMTCSPGNCPLLVHAAIEANGTNRGC